MRVPCQTQATTMDEFLPSDAVGRRVAGSVARCGLLALYHQLRGCGLVWSGTTLIEANTMEAMKVATTSRARHPKGGSFVRPKKASFGVDYLTVIGRRYEMEVRQVLGEEIQISTRTVEMVGFEAISEKQKVENLTDVARGFRPLQTKSKTPLPTC